MKTLFYAVHIATSRQVGGAYTDMQAAVKAIEALNQQSGNETFKLDYRSF